MSLSDVKSQSMVPLSAPSTNLIEGGFQNRGSQNTTGQAEQYDKTLFNLCYLM